MNPAATHNQDTSRAAKLLGGWMAPADFMLLLVAAIWGGSYAAAKTVTQQLPVLEFLFLRFGLTFLILLPALKPVFLGQWRAALHVGGILGSNLFAIFICETYGVSLTTASNAAFLISLCVAFTPICEWCILGLRPSNRLLAAAAISIVGAAMLSYSTSHSFSLAWGDALILLAAVLRGIMVTLTRKMGVRHPLPALTVTAVQMGFMSLSYGVVLLIVNGPHFSVIPMTASFWMPMIFLIVFCTVFAFFAQNYAAARSSPSRVALLMGSEPVFGALIAWYFLNESLTLLGWTGAALIVISAWWVTKRES
jgi:drug/metabolite transporter (DMT)-like permease